MDAEQRLRNTLLNSDIGRKEGAFFLVDGQYGSTGKGLAASVLAEFLAERFDMVVSNAGPNSGHTSYYMGEPVVLMQLPTFAVQARHFANIAMPVTLNAGAIIDPARLMQEVIEWLPDSVIHVHPAAAVVKEEHSLHEKANMVDRIGSTGKGTGTALADKIMRFPNAVVGANRNLVSRPKEAPKLCVRVAPDPKRAFVEVSQGFSLGINQGFYPYTTSRDCGVPQAMSDAGYHPSFYAGCMQVMRTFPIRVAGNSGPSYPDQVEISWEKLGQKPELTTVTKKVRRVFTWSDLQYRASLHHNRPEYLFLNFCNYLEAVGQDVNEFVEDRILAPYYEEMGHAPKMVLLGFGPHNENVEVY